MALGINNVSNGADKQAWIRQQQGAGVTWLPALLTFPRLFPTLLPHYHTDPHLPCLTPPACLYSFMVLPPWFFSRDCWQNKNARRSAACIAASRHLNAKYLSIADILYGTCLFEFEKAYPNLLLRLYHLLPPPPAICTMVPDLAYVFHLFSNGVVARRCFAGNSVTTNHRQHARLAHRCVVTATTWNNSALSFLRAHATTRQTSWDISSTHRALFALKRFTGVHDRLLGIVTVSHRGTVCFYAEDARCLFVPYPCLHAFFFYLCASSCVDNAGYHAPYGWRHPFTAGAPF